MSGFAHHQARCLEQDHFAVQGAVGEVCYWACLECGVALQIDPKTGGPVAQQPPQRELDEAFHLLRQRTGCPD